MITRAEYEAMKAKIAEFDDAVDLRRELHAQRAALTAVAADAGTRAITIRYWRSAGVPTALMATGAAPDRVAAVADQEVVADVLRDLIARTEARLKELDAALAFPPALGAEAPPPPPPPPPAPADALPGRPDRADRVTVWHMKGGGVVGVAFWAGDGPVRPPVLLTPAAAQELYDGLAPIVRRWAAPVGATGD